MRIVNGGARQSVNSYTDGGESVYFIENEVEGFYKKTMQGAAKMTERGRKNTDGRKTTEVKEDDVTLHLVFFILSLFVFHPSLHLSLPRSGWYLIKLSHHR